MSRSSLDRRRAAIVLFAGGALFGVGFSVVVPAAASTVGAVSEVVLAARPPSSLPPGSAGTLAHAIAAQ